jgi:hypothetical protein
MRGADSKQEGMFSSLSPESRIPTNQPLRPIRAIVAEALTPMDRKLVSLYSQHGRPSIAPECLFRALLPIDPLPSPGSMESVAVLTC